MQSTGINPTSSGNTKFESLEQEKEEEKKKEEEEFKKNSVAAKMARGEEISEPESTTFYPQWAGWLFGAMDMQFSFLLGKERNMVSFVANTGSRFNFNKLKASTLGADEGFLLL